MTLKRVIYMLLVIAIAGASALTGAVVGGFAIFRAIQGQATWPDPIQEILPVNSTNPSQTLELDTTDIETSITQSVQQVGPAVLTVVGTIPGQDTFFGSSGDQTVS